MSFFGKNRSEQIFAADKLVQNVSTVYNIFNSIIVGIGFVVLGIMFYRTAGIPIIGILLIVAGIGFPVLALRQRRQVMSALSGNVAAPVTNPIVVPQDETVVGYVSGVMAVGLKAATLVIGAAGPMAAPENAIVRTNKNVWFVYVPLPGSDVFAGGGNMAMYNFMLAQKDIESGLNTLLAQGLSALVNTSKKNFGLPLTLLKSVNFNMMKNVVFTDVNGNKYTYGVPTEGQERVRELFKDYIAA